jgi:hypothetical protein
MDQVRVGRNAILEDSLADEGACIADDEQVVGRVVTPLPELT